jgi:hypothetical protein
MDNESGKAVPQVKLSPETEPFIDLGELGSLELVTFDDLKTDEEFAYEVFAI